MSWRDRAIGIALGLIIGIVAVVLFVLYGSSGLDAPSLDEPVDRGATIERVRPAENAVPREGGAE